MIHNHSMRSPSTCSKSRAWRFLLLVSNAIELVMLALPNLQANLNALEQLQKISFSGHISAIARFTDEVDILKKSGATAVFNIYTEVNKWGYLAYWIFGDIRVIHTAPFNWWYLIRKEFLLWPQISSRPSQVKYFFGALGELEQPNSVNAIR